MTDPALPSETCTVAVVGGGTSGLALATELMRLSVGTVVVLEREAEAGGIPRHCGHYPFGVSEYQRLMKGPEYACRNRQAAEEHGVDIRTNTTVTALRPGGVLEIATGMRRYALKADRVVLCTGVRESSRAQRYIGGDRPMGVISTGALQSMVYLKGLKPFKRPVILGSELVSFSAIQTCTHLGMKPVAMVEEKDQTIVRQLFRPYLMLKGLPLHTGVAAPRIVGRERVEALEFRDQRGTEQRIETDGVIVSGRFRPESALLANSHLEIDPGTGGPVVDQFGRSTDPACFCAGNILRPAETSGFCWKEGRETARRVADDLSHGEARALQTVPVVFTDPAIRFAVPQRLSLTNEPGAMDGFYLGLNEPVNAAINVSSAEKEYWNGRLNSRPVRRIQIPLPEVETTNPLAEIRISIAR